MYDVVFKPFEISHAVRLKFCQKYTEYLDNCTVLKENECEAYKCNNKTAVFISYLKI